MKHIISIVGLLLLHFFAVSAKLATVDRTVKTSSGFVTGHPARNRSQVAEYLGIPYAKPPIGNLRFAAPQTYTSQRHFAASAYYPGATGSISRILNAFSLEPDNLQSEDCLTLNVWSKAHQGQKKAVLVWLYGGAFRIGSTNTPFYQGQYITAAEDVVFVSVNYRINIFGFSGAPGEPQNVGLLDQRKAIEWVRDNIAAFGGDPTRITIFGQSAGGSSVDFYSYAYLDDPIVAGLISHSGTAFSFTPNTLEYSQSSFFKTAALLGCNGSNDVMACVRSKDFRDVLTAASSIPPSPSLALPQPVFHPTIDNKTVFADYKALSAAGKFIKVPYLAGSTNNEAGFYKVRAYNLNISLSDHAWDLLTLEGFTCATLAATSARHRAHVPAWQYRYFGDWPNLRLYPGSGAYHGSDLHMIMGGAADVSGAPNTPEQDRTMRYMMRAWASFARDPQRGLTRHLRWPRYSPRGNTLVRLGYENHANASFVAPSAYDNPCAALNGRVEDAKGTF
ncbi:hypothetical protein MMC07_009305 [Pseudocyphellaria aurata]|nr:hypothetical protein [Pseudocyphellaria aurata]